MRMALHIKFRFELISGLVYFLLMSLSGNSNAQSWQWGTRGGSGNSALAGSFEKVLDLATDINGNVYVLGNAVSPGMDVGSQSLSGFGLQDAVFASFNCAGILRWSKAIGGPGNDVSGDFIYHVVRADKSGHVYVAGYVSSSLSVPSSIGGDTTLPLNYNKRLYIAQYDTSGNFNWLRMPQPDTMASAYSNRYQFMDMEVDAQGNVYWLGILNSGLLATGTNLAIPSRGIYILRYNEQGNFIGHVSLDITIDLTTVITARMVRDSTTGNFYIAGQYIGGLFNIGSQPVTNAAYVAAFNAQGQSLWKKENSTTINAGFVGRPALDNGGNLYLSGTSSHGDVFDGFSIINSISTVQSRLPFLTRINANGTTEWLRNGSVNSATYGSAIALAGSEVVLAGSYGATLIWPNEDSLVHAANEGYDVFVARFDMQSGALNMLDTLASSFGAHDHSSALATDLSGNIYMGGEFGSQLYIGPDTLLSVGGQSDFFIAKLGYPCGCVPPDADFSFTASSTSPQVNFLYTGSSNIDSLRWTFGDGNTSIASNPVHTYPGNGSYTACLEVYNACGMDSICQTVVVNCPAPLPAFSFSQNGFTVNLSYTGSAADSLHWDFGDGQGASGLNPVHSYSQQGSYTVCVTAFNGCGSEDTCETVTILSVGEPGGQSSFSVYPNPARDRVIVEGLNDRTEYKIINAVGLKVQAGSVEKGRSEINVEKLPGGIYVLVLEGLRAVQIGINR